MKFLRTMEEGGTAPRGYGVSWREFTPEYRVHLALLPFNHIIRVSRQIHHRWKYPHYMFCSTQPMEEFAQWRKYAENLRDENDVLRKRKIQLELRLWGKDNYTEIPL
jgi:hypothetical protein